MNEYLKAKEIVRIFEAKLNYVYEHNNAINSATLISDVKDLLPEDTNFEYDGRTKDRLHSAGIICVGDLFGVTISDYKKFRNVGEKTFKNIVTLYEVLGIDIKGNY